MKQSPGPTCLSRDCVSRATTLQDDKSSGGSPEDPHNLLTTSLQLLLLKQNTSLLNLSWETKFHKHCPLREVLVFLHFQQYSKQSSLRKLICKPQTSSQSLKSLKTGFLSLNAYCRSNRLHCKIYYQLNAQLWTEARVEYHDSNKK